MNHLEKARIRSIVIPIVLLVAVFLYLYISYNVAWGASICSIDPVTCERLFGCTPTEFFDREFEFYKKTGDFRKKATIVSDGSLEFPVSPWQAKAWKKTTFLSPFHELQGRSDITLSEDMKNMTVHVSPYASYGERAEQTEAVNRLLTKIHLINALDYRAKADSHVILTVRDSITGEVLSTIDLPSGALLAGAE